MAKFCNKCGAAISVTAKFCNACGNRIQSNTAVVTNAPESEPTEQIKAWSGWAAAPTPAATSPAPAVVSPNPTAAPPAQTVVPPTPTAPQSWDSYDYSDAPTVPGSTATQSNTYQYTPSRDASRPLPPLSDFFNAEDEIEDVRERAKETIMNFSLWSAGIVLCPIPFSDLVLLMPIQSAMVIAVGKIYGIKDAPEKILAVIAGACGASVFGQVTTLLLANFVPIIGKLISAPFVFGWTYGIGEVAMRYFESSGTASPDELKDIFKKASKDASKNYDGARTVTPNAALDNLREYMSEDEYRKIRERFGPNVQ